MPGSPGTVGDGSPVGGVVGAKGEVAFSGPAGMVVEGAQGVSDGGISIAGRTEAPGTAVTGAATRKADAKGAGPLPRTPSPPPKTGVP